MKKLLVFLLVLFPQAVFSQSVKDSTYQTNVVRDNLPSFYIVLVERLMYPLSWLSGNFNDFNTWRTTARAKVMECLLKPPLSVPFHPVVIAEQDRGSYVARKIVFNITAESRVLSYLLVPAGNGPFPAVMLLHDHGAKFDIGKEKVVEPFGVLPEQIKSAREWADKLYGGRFIGDELAKRGYVCFATDVLNWSDRGGAGYDGQQALASNLSNLGLSFAGLIAWEDMYAAEFLATRPEVDSNKVVAMGVSMGSFRAWQIAALSDRIAGGVAICWMATRKGLLVPGGNLTRGQSSFTTTHPNLANYLDYPDVASLACPKPMLFYNGSQDKLFPTLNAEEAFSKMHKVWDSQKAVDRLVTKLWNTGHVFTLEMQNESFEWLDQHFLSSTKK
jgi:pimeloyl-ACP methyl ester carboxylesterase